ncbi:MAG: hypothetical protein J5838_02900 [Desulfovibrio sp.]|nr:hypothetical protein [Desulfovibrio sp.]
MQKTESNTADGARENCRRALRRNWYDGQNREIVVYYLIAVFFLEIVVGAVAFFYGVVHAEPIMPGGPKMAQFPWVGWLIAAVLSPVGLLLLLHLSGAYFSRALGGGGATASGAQTAGGEGDGVLPERVERFYAIVGNAPIIVILLGLLAMGGALFFLDTAVGAIGSILIPYIPWILGSATAFLVICYGARLWFLAHHRRMEQEYAYRLKVLEKTGVIITGKGCTPLRIEDIAPMTLGPGGPSPAQALPSAESADGDAGAEEPERVTSEPPEDDIVDAEIVEADENGGSNGNDTEKDPAGAQKDPREGER